MKKTELLDISAKEAFKALKKQNLFCPLINKKIQVTRLFFQHIYFGSQKRSYEEIQNRLLLIPLIPKALENNVIVDVRKQGPWITARLEAKVDSLNIGLVLTKKQNSPRVELYSCFLSTKKRPISSSVGPSSSRLLSLFHSNSTPLKHKSQNLERAFSSFLQQQNLEDKKLLLMVSGGVDSMVLLHVAAQVIESQNLAVFHLNHNTRDNSEDDKLFVQNICSKLKIKFYSQTLDPRISLSSTHRCRDQENYWREQRKALSKQAATDFGAVQILTAHHATDLVETMLFRLTKGCGPDGLSPFETNTKPFWKIPKSEILDYAQTQKLKWKEDDSNLNTKFERNLIRHEVLPSLRKITPNLEPVFVRESQTFNQVSHFLDSFFLSSHWEEPEEGFLNKCLVKKSITLKDFLELPPILQAELLRKIAAKTPSHSEVEDALKWLKNNPKGNSKKTMGGTPLKVERQTIIWE